uniref:Ubiquitin-related modifier 1 homolog n=1 Tax=Ditylenchus dipsaci TaxID=166011 RepID=A0A915DC15_9BILA
MTTHLTLHFSGGAESLLNGKRDHKVEIAQQLDEKVTIARLLQWILANLLKECDKPELFKWNSAPWNFVLVNDADWEILGGLDATLDDKDSVTFISTLHGG